MVNVSNLGNLVPPNPLKIMEERNNKIRNLASGYNVVSQLLSKNEFLYQAVTRSVIDVVKPQVYTDALKNAFPANRLNLNQNVYLQNLDIFKATTAASELYRKQATTFSNIMRNYYYPNLSSLAGIDFRINVITQTIQESLLTISEQSLQVNEIDFDECLTEVDEVSSEPLIETQDEDQQAEDIREIKQTVIKIYEILKQNDKETSDKNIQKEKQVENSNNIRQIKFLAFLDSFLFVLNLISAPKQIYEALVWLYEIIQVFLNTR